MENQVESLYRDAEAALRKAPGAPFVVVEHKDRLDWWRRKWRAFRAGQYGPRDYARFVAKVGRKLLRPVVRRLRMAR